MRFNKMFTTVDTHTAGEPTRTITGGIPHIPGKTVSDKMLYLKEHYDWIRKMLMFEPRGNEVMSGVILTEPCNPEADLGVIFIEVGGYLPMCGHDTIGVSTMLVETGMVEVTEPYTEIKLDTPAGLVKVTVKVKDGKALEAGFLNIPSFVFASDLEVKVPELGKVKLDICYGGNVYAIVSANQFEFNLLPEEATRIVDIGNKIKAVLNEQVKVYHPELPFVDRVTHVEFSKGPISSHLYKNAVVIPPGSIDRSPCGTGTAAKAAQLYQKGLVVLGSEFTHESILGTRFKCRIVKESQVGEFEAVITEITGSAHITGFCNFVLSPDDPLPEGYRLG
jgi:proline racemase